MEEKQDMDEKDAIPIVSRDVLVKQGISAVIYLAGGAFLILMALGARFRLLGVILSVAALVVGIGALLSRDKDDKKPGMIVTTAGVLGMVMRFRIAFLQPVAITLLGMGSIFLFAAGIWKSISFIFGLKSRR